MKKIFSLSVLLVILVLLSGCFDSSKGKLRVAVDRDDMILYVDGEKKATVGKEYTALLLEEGDHELVVKKKVDKEWIYKGSKNLFIGADTSTKVTIETKKKATQKRLNRLEKEDETKLQSFNYIRVSKHIIKDNETGLMWQDNYDAKNIMRTWTKGKNYCENLLLDGYSTWRLPSSSELNRVMFDKKKAFINTNNGTYWTSSSLEKEIATAIDIDGDFLNKKDDKCYIRCVK